MVRTPSLPLQSIRWPATTRTSCPFNRKIPVLVPTLTATSRPLALKSIALACCTFVLGASFRTSPDAIRRWPTQRSSPRMNASFPLGDHANERSWLLGTGVCSSATVTTPP
jgi:hypothetical protein